MSILITENLKKYYDTGEVTVKALDGVDLAVEKGEFLAVVGTSGSGKSTLLHMLGGLDIPTSGRVIVEGNDISRMEKDELTIFRRRNIGFVFQNYNLLPLMNVYQNIVLPIRLDGISPDKKYVEDILGVLGLLFDGVPKGRRARKNFTVINFILKHPKDSVRIVLRFQFCPDHAIVYKSPPVRSGRVKIGLLNSSPGNPMSIQDILRIKIMPEVTKPAVKTGKNHKVNPSSTYVI